MKTYVCLLRGINVGGRNSLPMKELTALLEKLGLVEVRTYIQSGNVVFRGKRQTVGKLADEIAAAIEKRRGFKPGVLVFPPPDLAKAIEGNPFPEAEGDPKTLHVSFLESKPANPDLEKLESLRKPNERFELTGRLFYLHAPDGIGRSKLSAGAEKAIGVPMTGRNWRTVGKIQEMGDGLDV